MTPALLLAALAAGFVGSTHCVGMCGGISSALSLGTADAARQRAAGLVGFALIYNLGRIASYGFAGALVGALGFWLGDLIAVGDWSRWLRLATGAVMVAIGLQVAVNLRLLQPLESLGLRFWRRLAPFARRLMPVRSPLHALALGALWGWLPCGLVYSMLLTASVAGSAPAGAAVMLAFGAGTLPAMVGTGAAAGAFRGLTRKPRFRFAAGSLVIALGLWTALFPLLMHGHGLMAALQSLCSPGTTS